MSDWNFADVWDEIARLQPDLPAVVRGEHTLSWAQLQRRSSAVATHLLGAGLGHQAKVAQYLHNSAEYIESLYACFAASLVPVNTNYRYVGSELAVDVHVEVDADLSVADGFEIARKVKRDLLEHGPDIVDVVVQIEPHEGES